MFRLVDDRFERTQGPKAPEDFLTLGNWVAPNKVQMKRDKKTYVLTITDNAAKFAR